ncbi:MAG: type III pantothenate kinase [Muribaculaceae bacterium]|nr:type III pantothenate kinase [Muribaculaceae bacterium]MDE6552685.1 type III pantothenate kinase [Muribaculaceae bacterium]
MEERRRFIAIDQGNTLIKLTLFEGDDPRESWRFPGESMEEIFSVVERWRPDCGAFCSVGRLDSRMVESLRLALDGRLLILSRSTKLPIGIAYSTPATLGLDRVALASGASMLYPGECVAVADAGTAVTLDIVDSAGVFRGGRITAGLRLRFESLHAHTSALPLEDADGPLPMAGDSTATAIRSGVVRGLADEITETFRQYKEHFGCSRLVLTGGDSEILTDCIKSRIPAGHVPDLMARGLLYIYKHNEI